MPRTLVTDKHVALILESLTNIVSRAIRDARQQGREEALAQIREMVAGPARRGPGRPKGSKNRPKTGKKRKSWWDTATPAEKAERTRKMLAGRGLKPKGE